MNTQAAFIEQHFTGFFGRGMMAAETINVVTEQVCSGTAGDQSVSCTDATHFIAGGTVSVLHDDGIYASYFVASKSGNTIQVLPPLRADAVKIERLWYNRAHPGKFYIRQLAQRIARATEFDAAMPGGRGIMSPDFSSGTPLTGWGATVNYYAANNQGDGGYHAPVRFGPGRTAYIDGFTGANQGAITGNYPTNGASRAIVRVQLATNGVPSQLRVRVMSSTGYLLGSKIIAGGAASKVMQWYCLPVDVRGWSSIRVDVLNLGSDSAGWIAVGGIEVFEGSLAKTPVIERDCTIVCLGDSWVTGDMPRLSGSVMVGTTEREPLTTQLALELPSATVIGVGVGGNTLADMLARFDADVPHHAPDVVVVSAGTNDSYHPIATAQWLANWNMLLGKIYAIGARPVIVGVPALSESDTDGPGWYGFATNDQAKAYATAFRSWY